MDKFIIAKYFCPTPLSMRSESQVSSCKARKNLRKEFSILKI